MSLRQFVNVAVFAVDVNIAEHVDRRHVDAPFVAVGVFAVDGGALELPFNVERGIELGDVIRAGQSGGTDRAIGVAISRGGVVVVFDHHGESVVVSPNARRGIPSESVGAEIISRGVEAEKMAARKIVIIQSAKNHGTIGQDSGRGGRLINHVARSRGIRCGINSDGGAEEAGVWLVGDARGGDGQKNAASIRQAILK